MTTYNNTVGEGPGHEWRYPGGEAMTLAGAWLRWEGIETRYDELGQRTPPSLPLDAAVAGGREESIQQRLSADKSQPALRMEETAYCNF